jgi:DNA repair protein SbcC/Rad50
MHLNKLVMRNFKKFRRAEVEFQDGLTGIVGSNGTGKSTIVEAIAWALYGNRASSIKRDFIRNAHAGESDPVEVRLTLSLGKQELIIFRVMKGKGLMPEAVLILDGQRIAAGTKEVDLRLEEILKISYQDFMKTFYARQKDLDNLLKEGGVGKREYLLKLLGLEDIKEQAIEEIKSDRASLEEQKSRLEGALAEVGDVFARLESASGEILAAEKGREEAERSRANLQDEVEKKRTELEVMAEKMRRHGLLLERAKSLEVTDRELNETIRAAEKRLLEIDVSKKRLSEIQPMLERLACILDRLEILQPKRVVYEETARCMAAVEAAMQGEKKALAESRRSLLDLGQDAAMLEELRPREDEHTKLQGQFLALEGLRDKHNEMHSRLKEEAVREQAIDSNLSRTRTLIGDLYKALARREEIASCREEETRFKIELAELSRQRQLQTDLEGLLARKTGQVERLARLKSEAGKARQDLEALGNIEEREAQLRRQDRDLDRLGGELNRVLSDLRGSYKVQELALAEAERSIKKVTSLGAEGLCPICERPLEGQRDLLIKKYEASAAKARVELEKLAARVASQKELIEGATKSRSNLARAFDELNAQKSRRSALQADLKSLAMQMHESQSEITDISTRIEGLGSVRFDAGKLMQVETALKALEPLVLEYAGLSLRLEDLPGLEMEVIRQQRELAALKERQGQIVRQIEALGYKESDYIEARKRQVTLKPLHDRFLSLRERARQIPALEERIKKQEQEIERLELALKALQDSQRDLGYNPHEYEALFKEKKDLAAAESEAQRIRVLIAGEIEIKERQAAAKGALENLALDLKECREQLQSLAYSPDEHEIVKTILAGLEEVLELARKAVSESLVRMGVLMAARDRFIQELQRKEELEKAAGQVGRRIEVVDLTRILVNNFMDQVLIRVKNDIARTAGAILEEVSGKYSLLKIDDDFNILVEDGGEWYPISRYSGGEIDMIAVSVRVAISEYLMRFGPDGESYSFLILDEVFGSQDLEHREKMIQMLRSLEERFPQIIAISHISDVQGQFDNTLQVMEDEMGNSRVEAI